MNKLTTRMVNELTMKLGDCPMSPFAIEATIKKLLKKGVTEEQIGLVLTFYFSEEEWGNKYKVKIEMANHLYTKWEKLYFQALEKKAKDEKGGADMWGTRI